MQGGKGKVILRKKKWKKMHKAWNSLFLKKREEIRINLIELWVKWVKRVTENAK